MNTKEPRPIGFIIGSIISIIGVIILVLIVFTPSVNADISTDILIEIEKTADLNILLNPTYQTTTDVQPTLCLNIDDDISYCIDNNEQSIMFGNDYNKVYIIE